MSETAASLDANVFFVAATEAQTRITGAAAAPPSAIDVSYSTLSGNKPNHNSNTVYIWQNDDHLVPYDVTPDAEQVAQDDDRNGTVSVDIPVQDKPYLVAYAVGDDPMAICSYGLLRNGTLETVFSTSVSLLGDVTTEVARIQYRVPAGALPNSWKQSLALWEGSAPSYTRPPVKSYPIPTDRDNDVVSIRYKFLANQTYTVAYLAGTGTDKSSTQIAAYVRFQTKS